MKYPQLVPMPSAVSDWLEEQLEARGIDSVIYSRYILSLLHSDTVDVIHADEDLQLTHLKKEVRRPGGSRKRFRRSSDWWKYYAQADAEKLKRSAAVECLMSASEQTCGIESLIDELCDKLKEIESDVNACSDSPIKKPPNPELQYVSPQELAKRYYAAFPPLARSSSPSNKLITLIPKWITSPKKKVQTPRKYENMKATTRTVNKQRFGAYFKNNSNNNNNNTKKDKYEEDNRWNMAKKLRAEVVPTQVELETDQWSADDDANMYDDLPVDITELLDDSPTPQDRTVEMMNLANMRDTGKREFISCGTNIQTSIWSSGAAMEDTYVDATLQNCFNEAALDLQFGAIDIGTGNNRKTPSWTSQIQFTFPGIENFDKSDDSLSFDDNKSEYIWNYGLSRKWSEESGFGKAANVINNVNLGLLKLNHNEETSPFVEVKSKSEGPQLFELFPKFSSCRDVSVIKPITIDLDDKDDLLTSASSHFRPINPKVNIVNQGGDCYADGATFTVSNAWENINYKRTSSGALYMENDFAMRKKYCEYKSLTSTVTPSVDFVLKYLVCQNDKACQTDDELDAEVEAVTLPQRLRDARREATRRQNRLKNSSAKKCSCHTFTDCPIHGPAKVSATTVVKNAAAKEDDCRKSATVWETNILDENFKCDDEEWCGKKDLRNIWSAGELCFAFPVRPPSTLEQDKLRQDVSQDGDQLLSDLSTIQKSYMEGLPMSELSCDLAEILLPATTTTKEPKKRRHSLLDESWSFAPRIEGNCLIQMPTLSVLRSVTL